MSRWVGWAALAVLVGASACGDETSGSGSGGPGSGGGVVDQSDEDGDFISDSDEGKGQLIDSDGDGIPDYQDPDSDNDGIPDSVEAGDENLGTPPKDSDEDGTPDFIDLDSDDNGLPDATEGTDDPDGDGLGNWVDSDNDGDSILDLTELGNDPLNPVDSDGDGVPDFLDTDSDNDTIGDLHEGAIDPDVDGVPSYLDQDSDGDCVPDALEAGDTSLATPPVDTDDDGNPDFHDLDSDNDGLKDGDEDLNCNGVVDIGETSSIDDDSDDDGVSDLVEVAAGTNPLDPADNPQANGDFVFVVPYQAPPSPNDDDLDFSTALQKLDVYVLVDRSGSMSAEIGSIKTNVQTVANNVTCAPLGNGAPGQCIPDIWWGAGTIGYIGTNGQPYTNHLDLQPDPALVNPAIPTAEPGGCCAEPLLLGTWSSITGGTAASAGCSVNTPYPAKTTCVGSPADLAGAGGLGYPCFRNNALPVILLTTDEAPTLTYNCPATATVVAAANAIGAKIIGIMGNSGQAQLVTDLNALATGTGAIDANNNNAPLVVQGADAQAATAIQTVIQILAGGLPLDLNALPVDDPSDGVDAVTAFVDHLETLQTGIAPCTSGLQEADSPADPDSFPDLYIDVPAGTPVCWRLFPKQNNTVMPTDQPQLFQATVEVYGDGITLLDTRDVYFLVPPDIEDIVIN